MSMSNQQNKVVVIFVEGYTDFDFYQKFKELSRTKNSHDFTCCIETINLKGIGNYKNNAIRKFNDLKTKYKNARFFVFLCYDTDVFDFSKKPPVNMQEVKRKLIENGAIKVEFIKARKSIEDWFLLDYTGVLKFLRLSTKTPKETGIGQEVLKKLFKKANRVYVKGDKLDGFIEQLDINNIIRPQICSSIKPLCNCIGLNCKEICGKMPNQTKKENFNKKR